MVLLVKNCINCIYLTEFLPAMKTSCYSFRSNNPRTIPKVIIESFKSALFPS